MSRQFYHVAQDNLGNLLFDVTGTMRLEGTGTLATIYGDAALTVPIANPMTNHPSFGSFKCYLNAGSYDFYLAKAGYTFETLTGVQGHGTMALQNAHSVAITGGTVTNLTTLHVEGQSILNRTVLGAGTTTSAELRIVYDKTSIYGIQLEQTGSDTGPATALIFSNIAGTPVGSINTTATTTTYATTSDARLKTAITPLSGALDVVQALRPVAFRWKSDDSPGHGFLASEVQQVVDGVISGEADAVEEDGSIRPQMIDMSKFVPYLVGACQALAAQVEALTARLDGAGA